MEIKETAISFINPQGKILKGVFGVPAIGARFPALIMCPGFGKTKSERKYVELGIFLAEHRIANLRFDFTGHGDSEGSLVNFGIQQAVEDLRAAHQYLCQNKIIDQDRLAILGHSFGALVAVLFQAEASRAKTLILLAPALQQKELIGRWYDKKQLALWRKQGFLDTPKGMVGLQYLQVSEVIDWQESVAKIKAPTLFIWGSKDEDVPREYSCGAFKRFVCPKKLIEINADHHFESRFAKEELQIECLKWLKDTFA
mgnify:CR=1 FL=1